MTRSTMRSGAALAIGTLGGSPEYLLLADAEIAPSHFVQSK